MNRPLLITLSLLSVGGLLVTSALAPAQATPNRRAHPATTKSTAAAAIAGKATTARRHCKVPPKHTNAPTSGIVGIAITTVPAAPMARFSLDGHALTTSGKGVATGNADCSIAKHVLKLLNPTIAGGARYTFVRWAGTIDHDEQHRNVIDDLLIHHDVNLQVGFNVTYGIKYRFVNPAGRPVSMKRVTAMTVRASTGSQQRTTGGVIRLSGLSVRQSGSRLVAGPVTQLIERVDIDGSNAVFASEQKFAPEEVWRKKETLSVPVLLFSIHVDARSRIRKQPVGTALLLTYPNGHTVRSPMHDGKLTLDNLVRGDYVVNVETPGGIRVARPVKLSSSQYLNLTVLTSDDKDILILAGLLFLALLIAIRLLSRRAARRRLASVSTSSHV